MVPLGEHSTRVVNHAVIVQKLPGLVKKLAAARPRWIDHLLLNEIFDGARLIVGLVFPYTCRLFRLLKEGAGSCVRVSCSWHKHHSNGSVDCGLALKCLDDRLAHARWNPLWLTRLSAGPVCSGHFLKDLAGA